MTCSIPSEFCRARSLLFAMAAFLCLGTAVSRPLSQEGENSTNEAPFSIGESLVYQIEWDPPWYFFFLPRMDAGTVILSIPKEIEQNGQKAVVIKFKAQSSGTLAKLMDFNIDDDFEFIADAATFCAISSSKKQREGKRKRDIDVVYLPETKQLHIYDVDVAVDPPVVKKDAYKDEIPECVKDIFSALYWLRQQELNVGMKYKAILGYDDRLKEVESVIEKKERIEIPVGKYEAWRLNTVALMGGLFKDGGQFKIWLSADKRKIPLQFEAKVALGKVVGKLKRQNK
jgi:hypothetical protein